MIIPIQTRWVPLLLFAGLAHSAEPETNTSQSELNPAHESTLSNNKTTSEGEASSGGTGDVTPRPGCYSGPPNHTCDCEIAEADCTAPQVWTDMCTCEAKTTDEAPTAEQDAEDALVVTGTRTPQRRSENAVLTEVISRQDLEGMGVNNIGDVLAVTGGVQVTRSFAGPGVTLQGLDEKHTLILIDGDRILGQKDGVTDLSRINLDQVERVEIVRGAASALYGADALGGVINIITRKTEKALNTYAEAGYGTDEAREATARIAGGVGDFRLSLSGGLYQIPSFDLTPDDDNQTTHGSEMNDWHIDTKNTWQPTRKLRLTLGSRYESRSRQAVEETESGAIFDREQRSDFYDANFKAKYRSENGVRTSGSIRGSFLRDQFVVDQRGSDRRDSYEDSKLSMYQTSLQTDLPLPANNLLSIGVDGISETMDSPRVSAGENCDPDMPSASCQRVNRQRGALFAQDSFTPFVDPYLTIVAGTRAEVDSDFGFINVPRLAVRYDPVPVIKLRASIGKGYRAPTFKELYLRFDNPSVGYTVRGNRALKPERSTSYQVSADWRVISLLNLNITGFRNEVEDLINFEQLSSATAMNELDRYQLTNVQSARTQGFQTEMQLGLIQVAELRLGYQWLDTLDEETNRPLMNRPEHQAHGSLQLRHQPSDISFSANAVWIGARFFYDERTQVEEGEDPVVNTYEAKPFTTLHANLRWQISDAWGAFIRGENLLDAGNPLNASQRPRRFVFGLKIGN